MTDTLVKIENREAWLNSTALQLTPMIEKAASEILNTETKMPAYRLSMGFPSRRALAKNARVGECWTAKASKDGVNEIMISPVLSDPMDIAGTVAHELVHAIVGIEHKHKGPFVGVIRKIGLVGKPTATEPGKEFIEIVTPMLDGIGFKLPHAAINPTKGWKKQPTRLLKASCLQCGYICRVTQKWVDESGPPFCPTHLKPMVV